MYHWCTQLLANLTVSKKLVAGFGLVLLLTLTVMLTGIHGIDRMIASSDEMVAVGAVDNLIKDARAERLQFLANGDMQHAKNIEELVDRMLKQNEHMRPQFAEGEGARRLAGLNAAVLAYRQSLGDLIRAQETRNAARAVLVKSAESSLQVFEKLQNQLFDELALNSSDSQLLGQAREVFELNRQLLSIRYLVRGFVFQQTPESEQPALAALATMQADLQKAIAGTSGERLEALQSAQQSFAAYQDAIRLFGNGAAASRQPPGQRHHGRPRPGHARPQPGAVQPASGRAQRRRQRRQRPVAGYHPVRRAPGHRRRLGHHPADHPAAAPEPGLRRTHRPG